MSLVAAWVWDYLCWSRLVVVAGHHVLTVIISRVSLITLSTLTLHSQVKPGTTVIQEKYKNIKWVKVQIQWNWEGNVRVTHRKFSWLQSWCQCWVVRCYDMWSDGIDLLLQIVLLKGVCVLQFSVLIWYLHQLVVVQLRTGLSMVYQLIPNIKPCENNHIHDAEARRENWVER